MTPAPRTAIQHLVRQLKADRPAWTGYLQGMWQVLPAAANLNKLSPGRVTQDSRLRRQLGQLEVDECDDLAPGADDEPPAHAAEAQTVTPTPARLHASAMKSSDSDARLASVEAQLKDIALALRKGMASPARHQYEERPGRQGRHCFCCGSVQHVARDCPKKFSSHSAFPSHHLGGRWLLDSGTSYT
jgi:hypothetical protein